MPATRTCASHLQYSAGDSIGQRQRQNLVIQPHGIRPTTWLFATRGNIAASVYSNPVPTKVMVSHALSKKLVPPTSDAAEQQVRCIFKSLWAQRDYYRPKATDTLSTFHARLMAADGMGSFQAGQVLADLKYVQLESAVDWWTFAASGPGRRRGLNRVLGRTAEAEWDEAEWFATLRWLQTTIDPLIAAAGILRLHAQDAQNALCEFDKYERVRLGQGRVRPYTPPQPR